MIPRSETIVKIPLDRLRPEPLFRDAYPDITGDEWTSFLASIRMNLGCDTPIRVIKAADVYLVWDGYQRWLAHTECRFADIQAVVLPGGWQLWDDHKKLEWSRRHNRHRRHLTVQQQAETFTRLKEEANIKPGRPAGDIPVQPDRHEIAKQAGFDSYAEANKAERVNTEAADVVKEAWASQDISTGDAYEIVSKNRRQEQPAALEKLVTKKQSPEPVPAENPRSADIGEIMRAVNVLDRVLHDQMAVTHSGEPSQPRILQIVQSGRPGGTPGVAIATMDRVSECLAVLTDEAREAWK